MPAGARFVIEGIEREVTRLQLKADTSNDFVEVIKLQEEVASLNQLKQELSQQLNSEGL